MDKDALYLVTGAAGFVGRYVTEALLEKGFRVRAMIRNPAQAADLEQLGAEVVLADMKDSDALSAAVAGGEGDLSYCRPVQAGGTPRDGISCRQRRGNPEAL